MSAPPSPPAGPGAGFVLCARSDAMRPWVRPGDRVRFEARAPRRGDVVLVALAERRVLQRLVRRRGIGWTVRGDARGQPPAFVRDDQILAVAVACAREGRPAWRRVDGILGRTGALALGPAWRVAHALRRRRAAARRRPPPETRAVAATSSTSEGVGGGRDRVPLD